LFPILEEEIRGRRLVYLDNAATTQKPWTVLRAMQHYYQHNNANVHRGAHKLAERATASFDESREKVQRAIHASSSREIVITKGCTESLNLVAQTWGRANLRAGDLVLLSHMEHHANIVSWQLVCEQVGARIEPIPITDVGEIDLDAYQKLLEMSPKVVGVVHVSNSLGTVNPIKKMAAMAHDSGAIFVADGAQALAHLPVDVVDLGVDFYSLSAHKAYGPTGVGALYGREKLLEAMPPFMGGGDMIKTVSFEKTTFADLPSKFEPGTPNIAGVVGWGAALDFMLEMDMNAAWRHEDELLNVTTERLLQVPGLKILGNAKDKVAVISFVMDAAHPHDIGTVLDQQAIAIRTGHHCCMPLMKRLGINGTARASLAMYNTHEEIDYLVRGLDRVIEVFA
jgi:cysteine desulfurase/selenocysteine lyase